MTHDAEYVQRVHDLAAEARGHLNHATLAVGSILYLSQDRLGTAVPVSDDAKRYRGLKVLAVFMVAVFVGTGSSGGVKMERQGTKAEVEIGLTSQAESKAAAGDFRGVLALAGEMNRGGYPASGAYWEGLAYANLGQRERAAQSFILAARYQHPWAAAALERVRR